MAFDFTGKTAIVTGGTQGIGLEIAKGIVAGGGHVALIARNAAKGEAAVAELGEGNKFYQLDVADAPKARETVEQIFTDLPQTNILITALASSAPRSSMRSMTPSGVAPSTSTSTAPLP